MQTSWPSGGLPQGQGKNPPSLQFEGFGRKHHYHTILSAKREASEAHMERHGPDSEGRPSAMPVSGLPSWREGTHRAPALQYYAAKAGLNPKSSCLHLQGWDPRNVPPRPVCFHGFFLCVLLVHRNVTGFCVLILYPVILLKVVSSLESFPVKSLGSHPCHLQIRMF